MRPVGALRSLANGAMAGEAGQRWLACRCCFPHELLAAGGAADGLPKARISLTTGRPAGGETILVTARSRPPTCAARPAAPTARCAAPRSPLRSARKSRPSCARRPGRSRPPRGRAPPAAPAPPAATPASWPAPARSARSHTARHHASQPASPHTGGNCARALFGNKRNRCPPCA